MKKLLTLLILLPVLVKAQFCSTTALVNMGTITPTTAWQNVTGAATAKRYWTFNATAGCIYNFSTCNSVNTNDTYLRLYSGTNPLTAVLLVTADDNGPWCTGTKASFNWTCPTTGTYSILLTNFLCANLSASTILSYRLSCPVPPPNNDCINAIPIALPYTSPVTSNINSTDDVPTSATGCGTQGSNVWYTVVGNNTTYTATTCNASTNFDTEIRVYTGNCSSLNSMFEVACNDDAPCAFNSLYSTVSWCALVGTTYYISVGYFASGVGTGNFVLNVSSDNAACSTLPVELLWFDGGKLDTTIQLQWATASETNNDYFIVQKFVGNEWVDMTRVEGNGTTSILSYYETQDMNPTAENNYYRLKQVDYNGQYEIYTPIVIYIPSTESRKILMIFDILGRSIENLDTFTGAYFILYDDGSIKKQIK